ncbi:hypothetical protein [Streptomyces sp. NPDC005096]|uniref:hypothetical protein n=1 Tax=Streptomyces sp. NPDC005096 TaxID=3154559 RepID=UPI0033A410A5
MPVPTDPRTTQQRVRDQLAAARKQLVGSNFSRSQRRQIADRIWELTETERRLAQ